MRASVFFQDGKSGSLVRPPDFGKLSLEIKGQIDRKKPDFQCCAAILSITGTNLYRSTALRKQESVFSLGS